MLIVLDIRTVLNKCSQLVLEHKHGSSSYLLGGESSADGSGLLGSEVNGEELLTGELLSELWLSSDTKGKCYGWAFTQVSSKNNRYKPCSW